MSDLVLGVTPNAYLGANANIDLGDDSVLDLKESEEV